jgi:hypothetical protein
MIHIIINILLIILAIILWKGNLKITKDIKNNVPVSYDALLHKFSCITGLSNFDVFKLAAKEKGFAEYLAEEHFSRHIRDGADWFPQYVKDFLDDGREHILTYKVNKWVI